MARGVPLLSLVLALLVGAFLWSAQSGHSPGAKANRQIEQAQQAATAVTFQQAASALEDFRTVNGTYAGTSRGRTSPRTASRPAARTWPGRAAPLRPAPAELPDAAEELGDLGRACRAGIREGPRAHGRCLGNCLELVFRDAEVAQALVAGEA